MMRAKKSKLFFLGIIILLIALLRWNTFTHVTAAQVKVIEVRADEIVVQNLSGDRETVQIPEGIFKLIEVNREYWIEYEHREWEKPTLVSIEP